MLKNTENRISGNPTKCAQEINALHDKMRRHADAMLQKATRIGELLSQMKEKLPHGQFANWLTENVSFSARTAQNYMRIYCNKELIKNENVSLLSDAYNILKLPRVKLRQTGEGEEKRYLKTFSLYSEEKEVLEDALNEAKEMLETDSDSEAIYHISYDWLSMQT